MIWITEEKIHTDGTCYLLHRYSDNEYTVSKPMHGNKILKRLKNTTYNAERKSWHQNKGDIMFKVSSLY